MVFTLGDFTNVWLLTHRQRPATRPTSWRRSPTATFLMGKIDWGMGVFATALPVTLLFICRIKKIR